MNSSWDKCWLGLDLVFARLFVCFFLVKLTLFCSCDVCFCCVRFCFFSTMPRYWPGRTSPKWPISCWVGRKTLTQSINQSRQGRGMEGEGRKEQEEGMERKGRNLHPEQKKWKVGAGVPSYHVVAKRYSPVTAVKRFKRDTQQCIGWELCSVHTIPVFTGRVQGP